MEPSTLRAEARDSFFLSAWFCPPCVLFTIIFLRTKDPFWPYLIVSILTCAFYGVVYWIRPHFRFVITQIFEFLYLGCVVTFLALNARWCALKTWDNGLGKFLLVVMIVFNTIQVILSLMVNYRLTKIFFRYKKVYKSYYFRKLRRDIETGHATNATPARTPARIHVPVPPVVEEVELTPSSSAGSTRSVVTETPSVPAPAYEANSDQVVEIELETFKPPSYHRGD